MWKKTTSILLVVLLINFTSGLERWYKKNGVVNSACPLDDDPDDPTVLPFDGDCTKFLKCSYGSAYTLSCPTGLHWANSLSRCESPKVANCIDSGQHKNDGCTFDYKPHPTDCTKGIQCYNGVELELECPDGASWDKLTNKCSFTVDNCIDSGHKTDGCTFVYKPHPTDCTKGIQCYNGVELELECPDGASWDKLTNKCSFIVDSCIDSGHKNDGCTFDYKPHPTDCTKGIQCYNGVELELECPDGASWDKLTNKCSFIDAVC